MDMPDWEEEEKARRKKEIVEYRTKKTRSTIFMLCASVFEIAETLILMLGLFLLMSFILFRLCDESQQAVQIAFQILSIVVFIGSMILGFIIYKLTIRAIAQSTIFGFNYTITFRVDNAPQRILCHISSIAL